MSHEEARYSAILALDTLAEQSGAAAFRYMGTTTRTSLPFDLDDCEDAGIDFNLVASRPLTVGRGVYHARCRPTPTSEGTKSEVFVRNQLTKGWGIGNNPPSNNNIDLTSVWLHEALHSYNMTHAPSVVSGAAISGHLHQPGVNAQRDLYEHDLKCIEEITNRRSAIQSYRVQQNGNFGGTQTLSLYGSNGSIGLTKNSNNNPGNWYLNTAYRHQGAGVWRPLNTTFWSGAYIVDSEPQNTIGWSPTVWREQENRDLINYSYWKDDVQYSALGRHEIRQYASTNGFYAHSNYPLYRCTFMIVPFYCGFYLAKIFSGKKTATAWDSSINRTHFAWVNQNRQSDAASRQIFISTGQAGDGFVMPAFATGFQTHVSPGVACGGTNTAGTYDCLLAYVPQQNTVGEVKIRRFFSVFTGYNYTLIFDPVEYSIPSAFRTASSIALWYHNNKYWIAFRTTLEGQPNVVFSSTNGNSWVFGGMADYSAIGPSAVSFMETGNNYLSVWQ